MKNSRFIILLKENYVELFVTLTIIIIYLLRYFLVVGDFLTLSQKSMVQMSIIPLIYGGMLLIMILKKTYQKSAFSKLFFQSYLILVVPLHVIVYYMIAVEFNIAIIVFVGGYLLLAASFFFLIRKKKKSFFRIVFWIIDAMVQFIFVYVWLMVIGFQNMSI